MAQPWEQEVVCIELDDRYHWQLNVVVPLSNGSSGKYMYPMTPATAFTIGDTSQITSPASEKDKSKFGANHCLGDSDEM